MKNSFKMLLFFTLITGILYPVMVTVFAQLFFPFQANGSLISKDKELIGSALIGQKFNLPKYFWGRPSASDYGTMPSGASNFSPTSKDMKKRVLESSFNSVDLITTSASGLDPHVSLVAIYEQLPRVTLARGLTAEKSEELKHIIGQMVEGKSLGFLGQERINVLRLNIALDNLQ